MLEAKISNINKSFKEIKYVPNIILVNPRRTDTRLIPIEFKEDYAQKSTNILFPNNFKIKTKIFKSFFNIASSRRIGASYALLQTEKVYLYFGNMYHIGIDDNFVYIHYPDGVDQVLKMTRVEFSDWQYLLQSLTKLNLIIENSHKTPWGSDLMKIQMYTDSIAKHHKIVLQDMHK